LEELDMLTLLQRERLGELCRVEQRVVQEWVLVDQWVRLALWDPRVLELLRKVG
jgi:hypothetical protein